MSRTILQFTCIIVADKKFIIYTLHIYDLYLHFHSLQVIARNEAIS